MRAWRGAGRLVFGSDIGYGGCPDDWPGFPHSLTSEGGRGRGLGRSVPLFHHPAPRPSASPSTRSAVPRGGRTESGERVESDAGGGRGRDRSREGAARTRLLEEDRERWEEEDEVIIGGLRVVEKKMIGGRRAIRGVWDGDRRIKIAAE
ncbi:hypothetical protein KM043_005007 [Ampulex compressa]|nr:hypothetical protein KM043_005007 [Ampulex compressa]